MFEYVRYERSLFLQISITGPNILKQSKFTNLEQNKMKNQTLEKIRSEKCSKQY